MPIGLQEDRPAPFSAACFTMQSHELAARPTIDFRRHDFLAFDPLEPSAAWTSTVQEAHSALRGTGPAATC